MRATTRGHSGSGQQGLRGEQISDCRDPQADTQPAQESRMQPAEGRTCVLLFSGGRDSTLAAVRLSRAGWRLILVTVTSDHLTGIAAVHARLQELAPRLARPAEWWHVIQEVPGLPEAALGSTCLPCHHDYAMLGVQIARATESTALAFGYAAYQADWPEQTPEGVSTLRTVLHEGGLDLVLPTYDLASKDEAVRELEALGLTVTALEQKCMRQLVSTRLPIEVLEPMLATWAQSLRKALAISTLQARIVEKRAIESIAKREGGFDGAQ